MASPFYCLLAAIIISLTVCGASLGAQKEFSLVEENAVGGFSLAKSYGLLIQAVLYFMCIHMQIRVLIFTHHYDAE
jgi:hypothetical protein